MTTWTKQVKPTVTWSRQDKISTFHYLLFQNGDNTQLQNGDLLYTHNTLGIDWTKQAKPS